MSLLLTKMNTSEDVKYFAGQENLSADNLFVISNIGQLNHVAGLIDRMSFSRCFLMVVYTPKNYIMPQLVHDNLPDSVFAGVLFLQIPVNPNRINLRLSKELSSTYSKVLDMLKPKKLFLNSFQYHYSLLAALAKHRGIKLALVEEGLGTYRLGGLPNEGEISPLTLSDVKKISKETIGSTQVFKKIYKKSKSIYKRYEVIYKGYKEIKDFSMQSKKLIAKIYQTPAIQGFLLLHHPSQALRSTPSANLTFDESYTAFPNLTNKIFDIKNNQFYFSFSEEALGQVDNAKAIIEKYQITSNDYIYLSQNFKINRMQYIAFLKKIFFGIITGSDSRIFIKLHPKKEHKKIFDELIKLEKQTLGRICLIRESDFLIEELIRQSGIKGVVGITSSALIYTSLISPRSKIYSIADMLTQELKGDVINKQGVIMVQEHSKILRQFDHIVFLSNVKQIC